MRTRLVLAACLTALLLPSVASAGYRDVVLGTHPDAYWGLGEEFGTTAYDFVGGHNGYYRQPGPGVSWLRDAEGLPATGALDGGLWIHGNGDVRGGDYAYGDVEISQRTGWANFYGRHPFSANVWLQWDGYVRYFTSDLTQGVLGTENLNYYLGGWGITIPGGTGEPGPAKLQFTHSFTATGVVTSSVTLPLGEWTMVTATYDGLTMRLYQDGKLVGQNDDPSNMFGGYADSFYVGVQDFNRFFSGYWGSFNGTIDELTYWNRGLTDAEVTAIYNAGAPAPPPPPPPPPPPDNKPIFYFVPGVAGSELREQGPFGDQSIWPDAVVWSHLHGILPGVVDPIEGLRVGDDGTTSVHSVYASKVQDTAFGSVIYGIALDEFQHMVDEGVIGEFDPFPYDWRLGVENAAAQLALNLEARCTTPHGPIWIASHSTGGLVVKAALRVMRELGGKFTPEQCLAGGGLFFLAVPHGGAAKAIGSMINPDLFFDGLIDKTIADSEPFAHDVNNWLTVWQLMPPHTNNHDPFASREGWFNNPSDGLGDENVNKDQLNWSLDEKANAYAAYTYDYAQTVGALPVYNIFGYNVETPGAYDPGTCDTFFGHRIYTGFDHNAHLSETIYGDHTVPVWSALWPDSGIAEQSQYAVSDMKHGRIPENGSVQELIREVIGGSPYPDVLGLAHGHAAASLGNAARFLFWRTDICSPVAAVAHYDGGTMGMQPDGTVLDGVRDALYEPGAEDAGFKAQTFVIPQLAPVGAPDYTLTAIGDGKVAIWQTDPDGSQHDFVFQVHTGDTATLTRGADEWQLAIDRGGNGTVDETLVANRAFASLAPTAPALEGSPLSVRAYGGTADGAPVTYRWELVSGNGMLDPSGAEATYRPDDGPSTARIRVTVDDGQGLTASAETTVDVLNAPPGVSAGSDLSAPWGVPTALHGTASDPSAADRAAGLDPRWSFGDGASAAGTDVVHVYDLPGAYSATLTATDKDSASASSTGGVTVTQRAARLEWAGSSSAPYGFAKLAVDVVDTVDSATARLGGLPLTLSVGGVELHATTNAGGHATFSTSIPLELGTQAVSVALDGNSLYLASPRAVTLDVTNGNGSATVGAETAGGAKLSGNVHGGSSGVKGELNWRGADGIRLHVQAFVAYGQDAATAWVQGVADDGGHVVVHLAADDIVLWMDGVRQPGSGPVAQGTVKVH